MVTSLGISIRAKMALRFKTVTIEEVTDRTGTKNSKGIFGEETQKITNFSKSVCFKRKLYSP